MAMPARTRSKLGITILGRIPPGRVVPATVAAAAAPPASRPFRDCRIALTPSVPLASMTTLTAFVDVALRNDGGEPRWFLVPSICGSTLDRSVHAATLRAGGESGLVVVVHFTGRSSFHAVRLPAGGEVRVARLPIEQWRVRRPPVLLVDVVAARGLAIDGVPAEQWLGAEPTCARFAEARHEALAVIGERTSLDLTELPIDLIDEQHTTLRVE